MLTKSVMRSLLLITDLAQRVKSVYKRNHLALNAGSSGNISFCLFCVAPSCYILKCYSLLVSGNSPLVLCFPLVWLCSPFPYYFSCVYKGCASKFYFNSKIFFSQLFWNFCLQFYLHQFPLCRIGIQSCLRTCYRNSCDGVVGGAPAGMHPWLMFLVPGSLGLTGTTVVVKGYITL